MFFTPYLKSSIQYLTVPTSLVRKAKVQNKSLEPGIESMHACMHRNELTSLTSLTRMDGMGWDPLTFIHVFYRLCTSYIRIYIHTHWT